ncbi:MAG: hypothetical protein N2689_04190 [Verrucomicrobiae bacterium]|nr:hypothetical protein [Verrucomicrobiae bacterium]
MKRAGIILASWLACVACAWTRETDVSGVITISVSPAAPSNVYIIEIAQRAGCFYDQQPPGQTGRGRVLVLAGEHKLTNEQRDKLAAFVENGGALVSLGGLHGMQKLFGAEPVASSTNKTWGACNVQQLGEGYLDVRQSRHPVFAGLKSSLHFFGGLAGRATSAKAAGSVLDRHRRTKKLPVLLERRVGRGMALLIAPDLLNSIVHIQQGIAVLRDGTPAFDGTMPVNDGALKTDDGQVLDCDFDRVALAKGEAPVFLYPVADELRLIILRAIQYAARAVGQQLVQIAPWPRDVPAVGCISHDSDGNRPDQGWALLEQVKKAGIRTTWCMMFPCAYPRALYDAVRAADCEIALHYDAMKSDADHHWGFDKLLKQLDGLRMNNGVTEILSNKNHYTRWEGRLDFFRWCEQAGLKTDGTMGPSKQGGCGFPRGTCQPWRPLDDEAAPPRFLEVYEIPLITQDLDIHLPAKRAPRLLDQAVAHGGLAHFLFHPAHIQKPGMADAMQTLVKEGRQRGMEWWTHAEVWRWETARRTVRLVEATAAGNKLRVKLTAERPLKGATLIVHEPDGKQRRLTRDLPASQMVEWTL